MLLGRKKKQDLEIRECRPSELKNKYMSAIKGALTENY